MGEVIKFPMPEGVSETLVRKMRDRLDAAGCSPAYTDDLLEHVAPTLGAVDEFFSPKGTSFEITTMLTFNTADPSGISRQVQEVVEDATAQVRDFWTERATAFAVRALFAQLDDYIENNPHPESTGA